MKTLIGWTDGYGNNEKAYVLGDRKKITDMTIELADGKDTFYSHIAKSHLARIARYE